MIASIRVSTLQEENIHCITQTNIGFKLLIIYYLFIAMKHLLVLIFAFALFSCSQDDGACTETVCFGDGNCIEKPVEGASADCF